MRARTGVGRAAPEGPQPRRKGHSRTPAHRGRHAHPGGGRASAPGREEAGAEGLVAVVARAGGDGAGPRSHLALLRKALRPGAHLPLPQAEHGMDHPSGSPPRAGRPVDVAGRGRLHTAKVGARSVSRTSGCRGSGATMRVDLRRCGSIGRFRRFWCRWARQRRRRNPAEDRPEGPKAASLAEPNAIRRSKRLPELVKKANVRGFAMEHKAHRKTPHG